MTVLQDVLLRHLKNTFPLPNIYLVSESKLLRNALLVDMEEVGVRVIAKSICQAREFIVYAKWCIATLNLHDKLRCLCRHSAMAAHALDGFICLFEGSLPTFEEVEHRLRFVSGHTLDTYVFFHDAGIIPFMLVLCQIWHKPIRTDLQKELEWCATTPKVESQRTH